MKNAMSEAIEVSKVNGAERFIVFPIQHQTIYDLYQKAKHAFWVTEEIDFEHDRADFDACKPAERRMLEHVLAFFAQGDTIVNENIISRFMTEVPFPECRQFYGMQMAGEVIHAETYAMAITECIKDTKRQSELFRAILHLEGVRRKSQWAIDYMESKTKTLPERLVAFVIVEGVFFQCAFAVIFWFKKMYPAKLKGITYSNELIAADEALHTDHGVEVYKLLSQRLPDKQVHEIFQSAMEAERFFIEEFLEEGVLGLNKTTMIQFLQYMCDYWLVQLGHTKLYNVQNPLEFMDMLSLKTRTNFFERRNREYRRGKSVDATIQSKSFQGTSLDI